MSLWLIGAGEMGSVYARVLQDLGGSFTTIGRGAGSASSFAAATGVTVRPGGIARALAELPAPASAIVAVPILELAAATDALLAAGTRRILVEKPLALDSAQVSRLHHAADARGAAVFIAYNRRFHASVLAAERVIAEDGGLSSLSFEITEWSEVIAATNHPEAVKRRWLLANSTHVIDLAFFLGGAPAEWSAHHSGSLPWHADAARFSGAGTTCRGHLFSYQGDWDAPGRWGLELSTARSRLFLRPLEKLARQARGSVAIEPVEIDDVLDRRFKPGVYRQVQAFLGDGARLCTLAEHSAAMPLYERMAGYLPA